MRKSPSGGSLLPAILQQYSNLDLSRASRKRGAVGTWREDVRSEQARSVKPGSEIQLCGAEESGFLRGTSAKRYSAAIRRGGTAGQPRTRLSE